MFFKCPYCSILIEVKENEVNCGIFRCAKKRTGEDVNPHTPENQMKELVAKNEIWGCGNPFRIKKEGEHHYIAPCGWI